jgi:hypothetical protein
VVAFTDTPPVPIGPVTGFLNPHLWTGGFEAENLRVLSAEELGTPLTEVDLSELSSEERYEIRGWRAEVVSDVLFNWWD